MGGPKGQPEDVLDVRGLERGQDVVDLRRIVIGEVVVADRDHDRRADLGAELLDQVDHGRRAGRTARVLEPPAGRRLEVEVDPLVEHASADDVPPIEVATESPMNVTCCRLELPPGVTPTEHRTASRRLSPPQA